MPLISECFKQTGSITVISESMVVWDYNYLLFAPFLTVYVDSRPGVDASTGFIKFDYFYDFYPIYLQQLLASPPRDKWVNAVA